MTRSFRTGILFTLPAILVVTLVLVWPATQTAVLSMGKNSTSVFHDFQWAGLSNYRQLYETERFRTALGNTVEFAAVTVPFELVFGMWLALILNRATRGRGILRLAILFPWALPTALNALMWRWMFNTEFGLLNSALQKIGLITERINWLGSIPQSMHSMMAVSIWKTSSFMALLLLAGLQTIPNDVYEAGIVDGTNRWTQFRYLTLPLLRPAIMVALLLRTMDALRAFELPFNLTDGGPLTSTETLSLYSYRLIFQYVNFNRGSAAIIIQFAIIMTISVFYIWAMRTEN
jgi:ABC-type sugar transport system permease subunit